MQSAYLKLKLLILGTINFVSDELTQVCADTL